MTVPVPLRSRVAARLGLPPDAPNASIFEALDRARARKAAASARQSAEDQLYAAAWGAASAQPVSSIDDQLLERAWGSDRG